MNCPQCDQPTENGAAFCGNCGQPLQATVQPVAQQPPAPAPTPLPTEVQPPPQPQVSPGPQPPPQITPANTVPQPVQSPISQVMQNQQPQSVQHSNITGTPAMAGYGNNNVPAYAVASEAQNKGELKAILGIVFGLLSIIGAAFIPIIGFVLCFIGIILASLSWNSPRHKLSIIGLVISLIGLTASVGFTAYYMQKIESHKNVGATSTTTGTSSISTPCYSAGFSTQLNVDNNEDSCDMAAFNGQTFATSTEGYKVYAVNTTTVTEQNIASVGKAAIEKDLAANMPGHKITASSAVRFAGSPAYAVKASSSKDDLSIVEAIVYRKTSSGKNVFILVHADAYAKADLSKLEKDWQWK